MASTTAEAEERIRAVLRAHGTPDPFDDLVAHMKAVELGREVLPIIRDSLLSVDWSRPTPTGKVGVLTALMLIAHDVDERAAREISAELSATRFHPVFLQRLRSINRFTLDDYHQHELDGLQLFVSRGLLRAQTAADLLRRWLGNIPEPDLAGISRIYVVEEAERRYWGRYLRILSTVSLVWRGWNSQSMRQRLATEFTLYHEVGHHVHRRRDRGRQESEALADDYAFERFGAAHPVIGKGLCGDLTVALTAGRSRPEPVPGKPWSGE